MILHIIEKGYSRDGEFQGTVFADRIFRRKVKILDLRDLM
jgi:hypothetical protein